VSREAVPEAAGPLPPGGRAILARLLASPWLVAAALAAGTLLLYARVASYEFIRFDDNRYLTDNATVQRGLSWAGAAWAFTTLHASNWHPLTWLSHMLDVSLFGMSPGAHHLVNAALHAVNAGLLYLVLVRMTGARGRSAFVAALFAVHPLHVESVAWIAERKDVLSTLFGLLALDAYVRHAARPRAWTYALVVAFFAASLLSKPMWVTLPFLLLLLDWWPLRRIEGFAPPGTDEPRFPPRPRSRILLEKAPLLVLAALSSAVTVVAQERGGSLSDLSLPLGERAANAAASYASYVGKTFWPSSLTIFYPYRHGVDLPSAIAAGSAVVAATAVLLAYAPRAPWAAAGWCWFLGTLVPVIGLVQVGGQALADRYTYLPSIGLFVAIAWGAHRLAGRWRGGVPLAASALAVLAVLSVVTTRQLSHWATHESLFRHALDVSEDNALAHGVLADGLRVQGRIPEALFHAREAVRLDPGSARHWNNLAVSYRDAGFLSEANEASERSVALNPRYAIAWRILGIVRNDLGDYRGAAEALEEATRLTPADAAAWFELGIVYERAMRIPDAMRAYETSLRLDPDDAETWGNLAGLYFFVGRTAEATAGFETAVRGEPANPVAWRNLGVFYLKVGRPADGARALREALRLDPANADVLRRLALFLADTGSRDEALSLAARLDSIDAAAAAEVRAHAGAAR
jgi:Flp pilus assembly protein TadD